MEVRLSVFYKNGLISYLVDSSDEQQYHFQLQSAPPQIKDAPTDFIVLRNGKNWQIDPNMDADFREGLQKTLKKIPKK